MRLAKLTKNHLTRQGVEWHQESNENWVCFEVLRAPSVGHQHELQTFVTEELLHFRVRLLFLCFLPYTSCLGFSLLFAGLARCSWNRFSWLGPAAGNYNQSSVPDRLLRLPRVTSLPAEYLHSFLSAFATFNAFLPLPSQSGDFLFPAH